MLQIPLWESKISELSFTEAVGNGAGQEGKNKSFVLEKKGGVKPSLFRSSLLYPFPGKNHAERFQGTDRLPLQSPAFVLMLSEVKPQKLHVKAWSVIT